MTNFDFLKSEEKFNDFSDVAILAEKSISMDPSTSVINCRRAMEFAIKWMYSVDDALEPPYQDNLYSLFSAEDFRDIIGSDIWKRLDLIRRLGNIAVHNHKKKITKDQAKLCLNNLFIFMDFIAYCYADTVTPVNRPLSTDRLLELIHEAAHLQVSHINLMGGEVFLHRDWPTLLKELVRLDIAPEFISTKIPLDEIIIGKLRSCNYQGVIQVSLDAVSPTLIGRLTGRDPHYAQAILKSLMLLDESGIGYQIATVLTSLNCRTDVLREMYGETRKIGAIF